MTRKQPHLRISPPSAYDIAMYWRKLDEFVDNINEPRCFACQFYPFEDDQPENLGLAWRQHLERCHIVAASVHGSFAHENFLMLCRECHREAPMTDDRAIMIKWAKTHESYLHCVYLEIEAGIKAAKLEEVMHLAPAGVGDHRKFEQYARVRSLDFHPKASRADKIKALAMVYRQYIESGAYLENLPLFTGVAQ